MNILYSTQAVVECDGAHYYSNAVEATYRRYCSEGDVIHIICYCKSVDLPTQNMVDDERITFVFVNKINSIKSVLKGDIRENKKIVRNIVEKSDICFAHLPCTHGRLVVRAAKEIGKPCMTVIVGCPWDVYRTYNWKGKIIAPFERLSLVNIQKKALWSIYVTNRFLQKRYPTNGQHIGCSNVNITTGDEKVLLKRLNTIHSRTQSNCVMTIGTVGNISVPYKGQEYVIRAIAILRNEGIDYEYHLYGGGDSSRLKKVAKECRIEDRVFFHGAIPHDRILEAFDDMDIYAHPSKTEGLPRSLVEAESRGCLCLGTNVGGITELLDKDFLFPAGNVHAICDILRIITPSLLELQAKRNFEFSKQYDKTLLNKRRQQFINYFKQSNG